MKKLTTDIASDIAKWLETTEVKDFIASTKSADDSSGTFKVVITTENVDRYQEVIKLDAWELEHYMKNPVVLWGHDHSIPPIGICLSLEDVDGQKVATGKFAPTPFAQEIRVLYDLGIQRATSVGFIEKEKEGNLITKAELIEFSFVSVPANPYALALAMEKDLDINALVTRGFLNIKETEPAEPEEVPTTPEEKAEEGEGTQEERKFASRALTPIVDNLKAAIIALEALEEPEPEREEEPEAETEEEKQLKQWASNRKTVQDAATILGDVLAVARQAIIAQK